MKKIFYKGVSYEALPIDLAGKKKFALYQQNEFMHFIDVDDVDKRSAVSLILEDYYASLKENSKSAVLQD